LVEIQGTAEGVSFSRKELNYMLDMAQHGIEELISIQKKVLAIS
jgi:ribonuclease PH